MPGDNDVAQRRFSALVAEMRSKRGVSLADLAGQTYASRSWISNVEAGRRWPGQAWAVHADKALSAAGDLAHAWTIGQSERDRAKELQQRLEAATEEAKWLAAAEPDAVDLDTVHSAASDLAVAYLANPAGPMLDQATALQRELGRRLSNGGMRPSQLSDLYVTTGRVAGVLSYAALDLGRDDLAMTHTQTAWRMADLADDDELRAWVRGTQSLIARFGQNYPAAQAYIDDGLQYGGAGTSRIRLLCGGANCAANLGDTATALDLLNQADDARASAGEDSVEGLFGFSLAKQAYYQGTSLMWLPEKAVLQRAVSGAELAIETWKDEPVERRSLDDEALAHIYLATARLRLGSLDGAMAAVRPVLELPSERHISWIFKRLANLASVLEGDKFAGSADAADAREELLAFGS